MSEVSAESKIVTLLSSLAKVDESVIRNSLDQPNLWDSFAHVEMIITLEEDFGITFSQDEIAEMLTPSVVISYVKKKVMV
jgi:acyl carrier protein